MFLCLSVYIGLVLMLYVGVGSDRVVELSNAADDVYVVDPSPISDSSGGKEHLGPVDSKFASLGGLGCVFDLRGGNVPEIDRESRRGHSGKLCLVHTGALRVFSVGAKAFLYLTRANT